MLLANVVASKGGSLEQGWTAGGNEVEKYMAEERERFIMTEKNADRSFGFEGSDYIASRYEKIEDRREKSTAENEARMSSISRWRQC